jgi:diguanylate cyclase (GGDEF)-like protein
MSDHSATDHSALRIRLRERTRQNTPTNALAAMYLLGAFAFAVSALLPVSPHAPIHFYETALGIAALGAPAIFLLGDRWRSVVVAAGVLGAVALLGIAVADAETSDGTALSVFAFQWLTIYLAYYLRGRIASCAMALSMVALYVALIENDTHWGRHVRVAIVVSFIGVFIVLARAVGQLRRQATTDQLTGVLNRTGFLEIAPSRIARAVARKDPITLCLIDLDDFKGVNEDVGHLGADQLLVELTRSWEQVLDRDTILARYGGDEFILVACGPTRQAFEATVERLRAVSPLRWSAGFSSVGSFAEFETAIAAADAMMFAMKSTSDQTGE